MRPIDLVALMLPLATALIAPRVTWSGELATGRSVLDVDGNGQLDVATDIVYVARRLLGLAPVPPSFRQADPAIPPDAIVAASVDTAAQLPGTGLVVRDATGAVVGPVIEVFHESGTSIIARKVGSEVLTFRVFDGGFCCQDFGVDLQYESSDCSGPPLMESRFSFVQLRFVQTDGNTGYYANGPITTRMIRSNGDPARQFCNTQGPFNRRVAPAAMIDLSGFPAPFTMDLL